jgi:orotate phosphoribosyltransferase
VSPVSISRVDELEEMRSQLAQMVDEHALRWESVTLSSGKRSPYYFDSKQILHRADGARAVGELAFEALKKYEIRAVGGLTMGADPVAAAGDSRRSRPWG